jgi:hypothetical protein
MDSTGTYDSEIARRWHGLFEMPLIPISDTQLFRGFLQRSPKMPLLICSYRELNWRD